MENREKASTMEFDTYDIILIMIFLTSVPLDLRRLWDSSKAVSSNG